MRQTEARLREMEVNQYSGSPAVMRVSNLPTDAERAAMAANAAAGKRFAVMPHRGTNTPQWEAIYCTGN